MHALAAVVGRVLIRAERAARVRADPHVGRDDLLVEGALNRDCGVDCRLRIFERREKAVAGLLDDLAAGVDDPLTNELVVSSEELPPLLVPERLEKPGRVDDVGEEKRAPGLELAEQLLGALYLEPRPQPFERCERALELDVSSMLVASAEIRHPEQHSNLSGLVRSANALPCVACSLEMPDRAVPVLFRELDLAARVVDGRVEGDGSPIADLVRVDDVLDLVRGRTSGREIAGRNRDLYLCRETSETEEWVFDLGEGSRYACDRGVDLPFGEAKKR